MKYILLLFVNFFAFTLLASVPPQNVPFERQDSEHIKEIFEAWNEKSGTYLYNSIAALVMQQKQPERPNGVNKTPFELLKSMNIDRIKRLKRIANRELQKEKNSIRGERDAYFWQDWMNYLETTTCEMKEGSSTGEPHMLTFDGERYDFQNAGDYLLSSSGDRTFKVQTQLFRRFSGDSWSLNGGVIMNVNGDTVELKGTKEPIDGEIYINGKLIPQRNTIINLPQGGTVRLNEVPKSVKNRHIPGDRFVVKWPTGEQMRVAIIRNFNFGDKEENKGMNVLYQLYVGVPNCRNDYTGLLGNNDGLKNDLIVDDTTTINNDRSAYSDEELFGDQRRSPRVISKREQSCYYIAHPFADTYQLDSTNSIFPDRMTNIPDSVRYPTGCTTLADASDDQIAEGIKKSKEAGIPRDEMYSTVFDYTYANIDPKDQVDNSGFDEPERTENNEPDVDNDRNQTNPVLFKKPSVFPKVENKRKPNRQERPNTQEKPSRQNKPTNRGGGNNRSTRNSEGGR